MQTSRERARQAANPGEMANFTEGDFVLVAQNDIRKAEKLSLR